MSSNNLIESLDKPYDEPRSQTTGLMRLSNALAESCRAGTALERRAATGSATAELRASRGARRAGPRAGRPDRAGPPVRLDRLRPGAGAAVPPGDAPAGQGARAEVPPLRGPDARTTAATWAGSCPGSTPSAPQWMIQRLGELMWAVERVPLVLCVDQLEDMFDLGDAPVRFRRVLATLCDIVSRLPSAIVVISCLENFFDEVKRHLTQPISRRVTAGPGPGRAARGLRPRPGRRPDRPAARVALPVGRRPRSIPTEPTYPLPDALVRRLVGLGARDVLDEVRRYRERCIAKGKMAAYPLDDGGAADRRRAGAGARPEDRGDRAGVERGPVDDRDRGAVRRGRAGGDPGRGDRLVHGRARRGRRRHFEAEADGRFVQAERHGVGVRSSGSWWASATRRPQGGALGRQIDEVVQRAGGIAPVIVRSTAFPDQREVGGGAAARAS